MKANFKYVQQHSRHLIRLSIMLLVGITLVPSIGFAQSDILFTIDKHPVTTSEFKYIYEKNNREEADYSSKSIEDYLELYINFKLKVQKAKDLKYDQNQSYQNELAGYRAQLADSYIINKEVVARVASEIHQRQSEDVALNHILIPLDANAADQAVVNAKNKITNVYKQIEGGMSFEQAVQQFSLDRGSAAMGGDIGYINAPLPEGFLALEDAAYSLKKGDISSPIRTDMGFHILKIRDKRPARGEMEAKHLLIRKQSNGIPLAGGFVKAENIYQSISSGKETFESATVKFSEDKDTKGNEGHLGFFTIGQYEQSFEDAAFGLENDGDVSKPVETSIGWHIIKRVSKRPLTSKSDIEARVKSQPKQGDRFEKHQSEVVEMLKKEGNFNDDIRVLQLFISDLDDSFYSYKWTPKTYEATPLLSIGDQKVNLDEFVTFAKKQNKIRMRAKGTKSLEEASYEVYHNFVNERVIAFAEGSLEDRYPEFKNLMREYKEGILLFDITKDFVWDKAAADTAAIRKYYTANLNEYVWKDRVTVTNYNVGTIIPTEITPILNASRTKNPAELTKQFNKDRELVNFRQETLEKGNKALEGIVLNPGNITAPTFNHGLKVTTFKKVESIEPSRQKSLREARGYVISDYQSQLDKEWIAQLRKEYKISIKKKVLKGLIKK